MTEYHLETPLTEEDVRKLTVGDRVYLSGIFYSARDMAHIRMMEYIRQGRDLPFNLKGAAIFHTGPIVKKTKEKWEVVNLGTTGSMRMEASEADVIGHFGLRCIIGGAGGMGDKTLEALKVYGAVFLTSHQGCAALNAEAIEETLGVHWLDLGMTDAVWLFKAKEWGPLIVSMDSHGNNMYRQVADKVKKNFQKVLKMIKTES